MRKSLVSYEDFPLDHDSHDVNFDVRLDETYSGLNSDANVVENGERLMEMEWETKYLPEAFWPATGDRVWMIGRWIFDCGHPPYRTEIHPPKAVAFTRLEPTLFPGDDYPSLTNRTYIYIHGRGGYYNTTVADRDYAFDVPLPLKPSPDAELRATVLETPYGGPVPVLTPLPAGNPTRLHIVYPLAAVNNPSPDRKFAAVVAGGWREKTRTKSYRKLRITFSSIKINEDHDPDVLFVKDSGEWRFWVRANGRWIAIAGLDDVDSGKTYSIERDLDIIVPEDGEVNLQTAGWEDDCDSTFGVRNFGLPDVVSLLKNINQNDQIGILNQRFTASNNFGIGTHTELSAQNGDADTKGDFSLTFRIVEVARYVPNAPAPTPSRDLIIDKLIMHKTPQSGTWLFCFMATAGTATGTFHIPDTEYKGDPSIIEMGFRRANMDGWMPRSRAAAVGLPRSSRTLKLRVLAPDTPSEGKK